MSRHCWYWLCAVTTAVSIASDYSTVIPKRVAWLFFGLYTWVISKVLHTVRFLFKNGFILQNTFTSLQCNLHCALSQRSSVWVSLVFMSGRLRCWCVWLLGSPHYTPPQWFWSISHWVVSSILGTSQSLVGSCQDCAAGGEALAVHTFPKFPILHLRREAAHYLAKWGQRLWIWRTFFGESEEAEHLAETFCSSAAVTVDPGGTLSVAIILF